MLQGKKVYVTVTVVLLLKIVNYNIDHVEFCDINALSTPDTGTKKPSSVIYYTQDLILLTNCCIIPVFNIDRTGICMRKLSSCTCIGII